MGMKRDAGGKQRVSVSSPNVERVRRWEEMMRHLAKINTHATKRGDSLKKDLPLLIRRVE